MIPGVGSKRKADLIKSFKSLKAIREADLGQLREVLPQNAAESVYRYFHEEEAEACESSPVSPEEEN